MALYHSPSIIKNGLVLYLDTHRSYQYYSTSTTEIQQWWEPRVDLVDGNEPTLTSLLNNTYPDKYVTDLSKMKNRTSIKSSIFTGNSFTFTSNTTGDYTETIFVDASNMSFANQQTIIIGLKPTNLDVKRNPYDQAYWGFGSITQETNGSYTYFWGNGVANTSIYTSSASSFVVSKNETAIIAVTRNTGNTSWYKNGIFTNSRTGSIPSANVAYMSSGNEGILNTIKIGAGYQTKGFIGEIYFVQVYDRSLTEKEIKQNFEANRSKYGL